MWLRMRHRPRRSAPPKMRDHPVDVAARARRARPRAAAARPVAVDGDRGADHHEVAGQAGPGRRRSAPLSTGVETLVVLLVGQPALGVRGARPGSATWSRSASDARRCPPATGPTWVGSSDCSVMTVTLGPAGASGETSRGPAQVTSGTSLSVPRGGGAGHHGLQLSSRFTAGGCRTMAVHQLPKLRMRVRFPSSAPRSTPGQRSQRPGALGHHQVGTHAGPTDALTLMLSPDAPAAQPFVERRRDGRVRGTAAVLVDQRRGRGVVPHPGHEVRELAPD